MNNNTITRFRGTFIKYYEQFIKNRYSLNLETLENSEKLRSFEEKIKKIYLVDNDTFINFLINIHCSYDFIDDLNINTSGLKSIFFHVLYQVDEKIYNNVYFYKKNKKYIISTITISNDSSYMIKFYLSNPYLNKAIYNNEILYIITENLEGNAFELIKDEQEFKNFDFDNNDYENGENGLYLNPKNINFVSLDTLKKDGIIN